MISKVNVTTSATAIITASDGASLSRKKNKNIIIQNQSDADIYVALDGSSNVTGSAGIKPGIKLAAGGILTGDFSSFESAYAIHESTGNKVMVVHYW